MRQLVKNNIVEIFFKEFAAAIKEPCKVYLTGGSSAVLFGWRATTNDIDLKIIPDSEAYQVISNIKNSLNINLELASPDNFIPSLPNWEERSIFIAKHGKVSFFHFDFYSQALAKLERGFDRDVLDVEEMASAKLIEKNKLLSLYHQIEDKLMLFPAIDPPSFLRRIEEFLSR